MPKILIIEDDLPYRKIYQRKFEASGYQVETAEDGIAALEKIATFKPDIALVDLLMPRMDGFQFLDRIHADAELSKIPMVVITNLSTAEDEQKVKSKGAIDVLVKSNVEPNAIVERVDQILASQKSE